MAISQDCLKMTIEISVINDMKENKGAELREQQQNQEQSNSCKHCFQ